MNANEVISNLASVALGGALGSRTPVHPNDHGKPLPNNRTATPA